MSKRIFTKEQIESLLQNPNVENCSDKSIGYSKNFKVSAVRRYYEGLPPDAIFKQAGFNIDMIGRETPSDCLKRWRKNFKERGETSLRVDGRKGNINNPKGRPKGIGNLSDKEKLKYLEAQVAYLKAENDFLAKLRKKS